MERTLVATSLATRPGHVEASDGFEVRAVDIERDYDAYVELYTSVWDPDPIDVWPRRRLLCVARYGASLVGAYTADGRLVGVDLCVPGLDERGLVYASNGLCVAADFRGRGLGRRLRLAQRERALSLGIRRLVAPYDPLNSAQGGLYIGRLGQVGIALVRNFFGAQTFGAQRGAPTDRVILSWELASARVRRRITDRECPVDRPEDSNPFVLRGVDGDGWLAPATVAHESGRRAYYVEIPDRNLLGTLPRPVVAEWRSTLAEVLEEFFARRYRISDFVSWTDSHRLRHAYLVVAPPRKGASAKVFGAARA